jgi:hypothetical protein
LPTVGPPSEESDGQESPLRMGGQMSADEDGTPETERPL